MSRINLAIVLLWIAACGSEPPPKAAETEAESASQEHFLSEHQKAMDKARKLQEELDASARRRLEEVDQQTRDDRDDDGP